MKPERILLPIDVTKCPLEVFQLVNGFAKRPEVTVILLHVIHLNILAPDNRIYRELSQEALSHLARLADKHIHPIATTLTHVRLGQPAEQILAEAKEEHVDCIILPTYGPSFWNRVTALWKPENGFTMSALAQQIIREASCQVFVVPAKTRLDCEAAWGRPSKEGLALSEAAT